MPRIHHPAALQPGQTFELTPDAARHVQVLRLQPGDTLTLFGDPLVGGEWTARVLRMGRQSVEVQAVAHVAVEREPQRAVHLAVGMPANDRMDWLVEKATELGVASLQPLMTERSVLRLQGERAEKKRAHWQAVAVSACEQCGGNRVPLVHQLRTLEQWLREAPPAAGVWRGVLSLAPGSLPLRSALHQALLQADPAAAQASTAHELAVPAPVCLVHGPEGGLSAAEEARLLESGFAPVSLGPRVLRAETAALTALARLVD